MLDWAGRGQEKMFQEYSRLLFLRMKNNDDSLIEQARESNIILRPKFIAMQHLVIGRYKIYKHIIKTAFIMK